MLCSRPICVWVALLRIVIRGEHRNQVAHPRFIPRMHHFQFKVPRRADASGNSIIRQGYRKVILHGADRHHHALGHIAQAFARFAVHDFGRFRRHRRIGIKHHARHIRPVWIISAEITQMTAQHIALRIILFDVRPLLVEIHHVNAFVFIDRAKQFRVSSFSLRIERFTSAVALYTALKSGRG